MRENRGEGRGKEKKERKLLGEGSEIKRKSPIIKYHTEGRRERERVE